MVSSYQGRMQTPTREKFPKVRQFMSKSYLTVTPETDIYQAMEMILKANASGAPVVDSDQQLIGIVSEKDCLKLAAQDTYESNLSGGPVSAYMTRNCTSVTPDSGLSQVAEIFMSTPFKKLPVVEDGKFNRRGSPS